LLNQNLAEAIDLQLQAKQAHWNVRGPSFAALHDLFEEVAVAFGGHGDLLAERAVQLGGLAEGTLHQAAGRSRLPRPRPENVTEAEHVAALATGLAAFGERAEAGIGQTEKAGDPITADILTEVARSARKLLWLVEAHQEPREKAR
jgi:starvation-inducible DNA-binding protein